MTLLQRIAQRLAVRSGLLPQIDAELAAKAVEAVRQAEQRHKRESGEYRRHIALKNLIAGGANARAAAVAIEMAVNQEL